MITAITAITDFIICKIYKNEGKTAEISGLQKKRKWRGYFIIFSTKHRNLQNDRGGKMTSVEND